MCSPGGRGSASQGYETDHPETQWLAAVALVHFLAILVAWLEIVAKQWLER